MNEFGTPQCDSNVQWSGANGLKFTILTTRPRGCHLYMKTHMFSLVGVYARDMCVRVLYWCNSCMNFYIVRHRLSIEQISASTLIYINTLHSIWYFFSNGPLPWTGTRVFPSTFRKPTWSHRPSENQLDSFRTRHPIKFRTYNSDSKSMTSTHGHGAEVMHITCAASSWPLCA